MIKRITFQDGGDSTFWIEENRGRKLAFFIRANISVTGLNFFTDNDSTFQIGAMTRPQSEYIEAHIHEPVERKITGTQEVLFLQSGKIRVDIFDTQKIYVTSVLMFPGDIVLLCEGGHGFEIVEEARLIEVKQGPFVQGIDKVKFDHNLNKIEES